MKKYLEFKTKAYSEKDFKKFISSEEDDHLDESEFWKKDLPKEKADLPKPIITTWRTYQPDKIIDIKECWSLEEQEKNPDNPKLDLLELTLSNGAAIVIISTLKEFDKQYQAFYN